MLALIKLWEKARMDGVFSDEHKARLRGLKNEFHLEKADANNYTLTPVYNAYFKHTQQLKQPGEPIYSSFKFENAANEQPASFIIAMQPGKETDPDVTFDQISIAINQQNALLLPISLGRNQIIHCDGKTVKLYNKQWQLQKTIELNRPIPLLKAGSNSIEFDGRYTGENGADIKLELRAMGKSELIVAKQK
jgi:hypothetical protein